MTAGNLLLENTALAAVPEDPVLATAIRVISETEAQAFVGLPPRCRVDVIAPKTGQLVAVVAENRYLLLNLKQPTHFLFLDRQRSAGKVTVLLRHFKNANQTYYVTLQQQSAYSASCPHTAQCKTSQALFRLEQEKTQSGSTQKTLIQDMPVTVNDYCAGKAADRLFYSMPWYERLFKDGFLRH